MTHAIENPCELWHRRLAHINYKALPYICKAVTGLPKLKVDHEGVCNGCAQGKNIKNPFPKRDSKAEGCKFSDPNPVSISLIFQPMFNAQTQFYISK
jgi:hypothetical protein